MKKNRMMRLASVLMVLTLLSTSVISGTFAKYVTTVSSDDSARVAKWGFKATSIEFEDLFEESYTHVADGDATTAIIAPGTAGEVSFKFESYGIAPEVAYTFVVDTNGSSCAEAIQNNANITWALAKTAERDSAVYGSWENLITAINALDGNVAAAGSNPENYYAVGATPAMVNTDYTVLWKWTFNNSDDGNDNDAYNDTDLGNLAVEGDLGVTLKITITATQID